VNADRPRILDWAPDAVLGPAFVAPPAPLPNESTTEHVRNALQLLYELETHLDHNYADREVRQLLADVKRRLGWAIAAEARAAR
jgi:hypothetical protein